VRVRDSRLVLGPVLRKRPARRRASRRLFPVALSLIVVSLAPALSGAPASADPSDPITSKAAEARRLEAQIEANGNRISVLDEQYNQTLIAISAANDGLKDARSRIDRAQRETHRLNGLVQARAAALYTQAGSQSPFPELDASSVQELGSLSKYSDAAAQHDDDLIGDLNQARELLHERQRDLNHAKSQAEAHKKALDAQRTALAAASAKQEHLLSNVKGELGRLIRAEQVRQQRAAEAAFRAKIAEQQAVARTVGVGGGGSSHFSPSEPIPANIPAPSGGAQAAINFALAQKGKPYRYAGTGPGSYDCSGLTMMAWAAAGVSIPHSSQAQYASLPHVPEAAMAPGDLVFFGHPIHHVGMYLGNGMMIHAPQTGDVVKISAVWRNDFVGAARP
jgi:peptidoglycan DL-endopeptidase CwlO